MKLKRLLGPLIGVVLLGGALMVLRHELGEHSLREVFKDLLANSPYRLVV
jgi:hypothetical protein